MATISPVGDGGLLGAAVAIQDEESLRPNLPDVLKRDFASGGPLSVITTWKPRQAATFAGSVAGENMFFNSTLTMSRPGWLPGVAMPGPAAGTERI